MTSQHDVQDKFSKDMFGTDQVTVTVEYEGDDPDASQEEEKQQQEQQEQQEQPEVDDETLLNNDESKPDEKEQELDEEEIDPLVFRRRRCAKSESRQARRRARRVRNPVEESTISQRVCSQTDHTKAMMKNQLIALVFVTNHIREEPNLLLLVWILRSVLLS